MRGIRLLASGVGLALSVGACANILGDFTVGGVGDAGDSGGSDAPAGDAGDGGSVSDAGPDAPPPLQPFTCTGGAAQTIGFTSTSMVISDGDRVHIRQIPGQRWRATLEHNDTLFYVDFDNGTPNPVWTPYPFNQQILASTEYQAPGGQAGIAYLTYDFGAQKLNVTTFPDGATGPVQGPSVFSFGGTMGAASRIKGTLDVVDPSTKEYIFVVNYTANGLAPYTLVAGHLVNGTPQAVTIGANSGGADVPAYSVIHDPMNAFVFWPPDSSGGTPTGTAELYVMDMKSWTLTTSHELKPSGAGVYLPFAVGRSATQGFVDVAFLEGDLSQQQTPPMLLTGTVSDPNLGTFDPGTLSGGTSLKVSELPVNKGVARWVPFTGEDEFVAAGRPVQDGFPGVNLVWLDSLGRARWLVSETDGGDNLPSTLVNAVDFTFSGQPTAQFAGLEMIWTEGQNGSPQSPPTHVMQLSCIVK